MKVKAGVLLENPQKQDIVGHAIDTGVIDPDDTYGRVKRS